METLVLQGSTTTLISYPRVRPQAVALAVPSSVLCRVHTPAVQQTSLSATDVSVDNLAIHTVAVADEGARELAIEADTLEAGRRYLLDDGTGDVLDVECRQDSTGGVLYLSTPLPRLVDVGADLRGFACLRELQPAETAQVGEASVLWQANVGVDVQWSQLFRVVSRIPAALLTPERLRRAYPFVSSMQSGEDPDMSEVVEAAWEHRMVPLFAAKGLYSDEVISDEALIPLHAIACLLQMFEFDPRRDRQFVADLKASWNECISTTFARRDLADQPQDEVLQPRVPGATTDAFGGMRLRR